MGKVAVWIGIVIVVVVAGIWLLTGKKAASPAASPTPTSSAAAVSANSVNIKNFAFSPADISVKVGTAVSWTNQDSTTHTVTETDALTGPASSDLAPGQTYSFTFKTAGTYHYHCNFHSSMTGTVTVTD